MSIRIEVIEFIVIIIMELRVLAYRKTAKALALYIEKECKYPTKEELDTCIQEALKVHKKFR